MPHYGEKALARTDLTLMNWKTIKNFSLSPRKSQRTKNQGEDEKMAETKGLLLKFDNKIELNAVDYLNKESVSLVTKTIKYTENENKNGSVVLEFEDENNSFDIELSIEDLKILQKAINKTISSYEQKET